MGPETRLKVARRSRCVVKQHRDLHWDQVPGAELLHDTAKSQPAERRDRGVDPSGRGRGQDAFAGPAGGDQRLERQRNAGLGAPGFDERPEHASRIRVAGPILTNWELEKIRALQGERFKSITLRALFPEWP